MSADFQSELKAHRQRVDAELRRLLETAGDIPPALAEAMAYSLLAPGKRLRPLLALFACQAAGGAPESALPAGCAVEMVHTYSLIHDDLPAMDDDDLRRGLPTCHVKFGEATAILAGDALLTLAFQVLTDYYPPATAAAACRELAVGAGASGMVAGQILDLEAEQRPPAEGPDAVAQLEAIHSRKTGALFLASLRLGQLAAQGERPGGPDPDVSDRLDTFGRAFGLAFQITDDLLDVESTSERMGKRTQKDAGRNKLTYPGLLGVAESRRAAEALLGGAIEMVEPLGEGGRRLAGLAELVLRREG